MELNNSDRISVDLFDTNVPNNVFVKYTLIIDWEQSIMFIMLRYFPDKTTLKVRLGWFFYSGADLRSAVFTLIKEGGFKRGVFFTDILGDIFYIITLLHI